MGDNDQVDGAIYHAPDVVPRIDYVPDPAPDPTLAAPANFDDARNVIAQALAEREGRAVEPSDLVFAGIIVARLVNHRPPLLTDFTPME